MPRAEHKVPGGKLLRADVSFDGEIADVELHGDFFVYPEEALERAEAAMEGVSKDFDPEEAAERIRSVLGEAELVGFSVEDVVTVVREAIQNG